MSRPCFDSVNNNAHLEDFYLEINVCNQHSSTHEQPQKQILLVFILFVLPSFFLLFYHPYCISFSLLFISLADVLKVADWNFFFRGMCIGVSREHHSFISVLSSLHILIVFVPTSGLGMGAQTHLECRHLQRQYQARTSYYLHVDSHHK